MVFTNMHSLKFWLLYPYWYYYPYEKEYTFEQAEKEYLKYLKSYKNYIPNGKPVSFLENFKAKKQEGDKLYLYRSPLRHWYKLAGIEKFILVRDNKIIDSFTIMRN